MVSFFLLFCVKIVNLIIMKLEEFFEIIGMDIYIVLCSKVNIYKVDIYFV